MEDNFTLYKTPAVDEGAAPVPAGDFLADDGKTGFYLIVTDSKGRVAWEEGQLTDFYGHEKLRSSKSCRNRRRMPIKPTCATRASAI